MDDVRTVMDATGSERAAIFSAVAGSIVETLREGARVEFDVVEGPKGPQAADVKPAS
jgi:cold shock protein